MIERLAVEMGRMPTVAERRLLHREDPTFPSNGVFEKWGPKRAVAARVAAYCRDRPDLADVLAIVEPIATSEGGPWRLQVMIDESSGKHWVSRRNPRVRRSIDSIGMVSPEGVPYLAPEIQLLYKAKEPRPKDEIDFAATLPALTSEQRKWLDWAILQCYGERHPWRGRLS